MRPHPAGVRPSIHARRGGRGRRARRLPSARHGSRTAAGARLVSGDWVRPDRASRAVHDGGRGGPANHLAAMVAQLQEERIRKSDGRLGGYPKRPFKTKTSQKHCGGIWILVYILITIAGRIHRLRVGQAAAHPCAQGENHRITIASILKFKGTLEQAPHGFRPRRQVVLLAPPVVQLLHRRRSQPDHDAGRMNPRTACLLLI